MSNYTNKMFKELELQFQKNHYVARELYVNLALEEKNIAEQIEIVKLLSNMVDNSIYTSDAKFNQSANLSNNEALLDTLTSIDTTLKTISQYGLNVKVSS